MALEMAIWRMTEDGPRSVGFAPMESERRLEDMIFGDPSLVGTDLMVIGRQVPTDHGGFIDLLCIDADGRLHVLELKRDRTPREVVAQALDYGSWAQGLTLNRIEDLFAASGGSEALELSAAFADHFGQPLPDVVNAEQQLTIVASALDPASDRIVTYLAEEFGVPLNAVFFRYFADGNSEYLARTWLVDIEEAAARRTSTAKVRPWNGQDFYVILGNMQQANEGRWTVARKYGLLTAGGGEWYWKPLRNLSAGHRVFAYVGGAGYVGVGIVQGVATRLDEAVVDINGEARPALDLPDLPSDLARRAASDDLDITEYAVPVSWLETRDTDAAFSERGMFSSQVTVCKLRDENTIETLERAFGLV